MTLKVRFEAVKQLHQIHLFGELYVIKKTNSSIQVE
jgi:hypothetical protein